MAFPQDSCVVYEMGFAPLDLVDVPVGRMIVKLYPKISPAMPVHKCAHAFQVNKTALKDLPTGLRLMIDAFGAHLNVSLTIEGILSHLHQYFNKHWMDIAYFAILSFHNLQGNCIDNTTIAGNPQILLPIQDGAQNASQSQDVLFVCVQCTLDFAVLVTAHPYPVIPTLRVSYYIKMLQESCTMTNGRGGAYTLVSFLGVDDLCTLTPNEVKTDILNPVLQNGLVLLQASDFNLQTVNTNLQEIASEIDGKIVKLAWHRVCASIFNELCHNYSNQPQASIKHTKQLYVNGDNNIVCTSVFAYYQCMMNAVCPFAGEAQFSKSVCNALIDGLNKCLVAIFRHNYANHTLLHNLNPSSQHRRLPKIL